jgi:hypothetical protein
MHCNNGIAVNTGYDRAQAAQRRRPPGGKFGEQSHARVRGRMLVPTINAPRASGRGRSVAIAPHDRCTARCGRPGWQPLMASAGSSRRSEERGGPSGSGTAGAFHGRRQVERVACPRTSCSDASVNDRSLVPDEPAGVAVCSPSARRSRAGLWRAEDGSPSARGRRLAMSGRRGGPARTCEVAPKPCPCISAVKLFSSRDPPSSSPCTRSPALLDGCNRAASDPACRP